jgi:Leucine-rich repeat (LRR) protein
LVHLGLLALTYCEVTNLQWMSKLPLLNDLALNYVDDLESLSGLESVAHLHRFALSSTSVADLTPLSGLAELWYLDVSSTPVGPGALATISTMHLDYLDVSYCGIEDLELLAGMHSLDELYAMGNNIRDLQPLAKMSGLEHADLYENRIEDLGPLVPDEACPSLEDLDVRENPLLDCDSQYLNAKKILAKEVNLRSDCPYWIIPSPYRPR